MLVDPGSKVPTSAHQRVGWLRRALIGILLGLRPNGCAGATIAIASRKEGGGSPQSTSGPCSPGFAPAGGRWLVEKEHDGV